MNATFPELVNTPLPKLVAIASELVNRLQLVEAAITVKAERETNNRREAQSARRDRERGRQGVARQLKTASR